jgi:hypothetical protein
MKLSGKRLKKNRMTNRKPLGRETFRESQDIEREKYRRLQPRKKILSDQVIRDIEKLIVINIVIIIVFVTVTSVFEKPVFEKMEGSIGEQTSYPQGEPLDERFLTPAEKERSGMKLFPGTGLDRTLEYFRTWDSPNID